MKSKDMMKALALLSQVGIMMAVCILVGVLIGRFLDGLLGTGPWLLFLFSLLGVGAAFKSLFGLIPKAEQKSKKPQKTQKTRKMDFDHEEK